ncbi:MAG: hypothetical protein QM780_04915 [Hyphomicrobium sp.]|uniref:hypothetical protein n=1 Tax=Hyphomicrobium sp. TaxID=82 RepID=UPI0039E3066E
MMIKVRGYLAMMISKSQYVAAFSRGLRLALLSTAALWSIPSAVRAEDCVDVQSTSPVPDFQPCEMLEPDLDPADLNSIILESSASKPKKAATASDAIPWIATNPQDVPAAFSTSDTGVSVKTSLGTLRDYNARSASPVVEQPAFGPAPKTDFTMPQAPVAPKTPLDVWTSIDVNGYDGSRDQSTRTGVGADYKFNKMTTLGVSIERGDSRSATVTAVEEDQKASAYVTLQATPLLSLDARTEWQAGNEAFAESSGAAEKGAFILAPKINKSFKMDDGTTLSPFVTYQREFDVSASRKDSVDTSLDATQSAGAGVTYTKPDAYSLSVSADVDNFGATEQSSESEQQIPAERTARQVS